MQITQDIFKWLKSLNIIQNGTPKQNGRFELDPETTGAFYNGFKMSELLDKLIGQYTQQIKMQTNPTARLFNWNLITERLHQIKVEVDSDIKKLIIDGDLEMIVEILKDIHSKFSKDNVQKTDYPKKEFDVETLNSAKPLSSSGSIQEFIIVALSQNLVLKPKQSQQLLNNNFKLATHVFIKGVKGLYNQLVSLLQEIYNNMPRLIELCREEENQIGYFIQFIKLSLFSKDSEVVHWGLRLLGKLAFDLAQHDLLFHIFQWLINSGLQNFIVTSQRQPQLAEPIAVALTQIACYDFSQIFGQQKYFESPKAYIEFYGLLLPYINCDLINFNLEQQIQIAIRLGENQNTRDERAISLLLLCNAWLYYHAFLEQNMQYQQQILGLLQRSAKDNSMILKQYSITLAFKLLDGLAQRKVVTAVSVYKKLISMLVESQNNEYIVRQFSFIIQKYPSIPIELLIEGLIKNQSINIAECDIYYIISAHQNLKIHSAIQILELLVRIYNSNVVFQSSVRPSIEQIIQKFIEISEFQEFINRVTQTCLSLYVNSIKQKKTTTTTSGMNYQDDSVINQQRRALIVQLIKYIILLKCFSMNNQLKPLLVGAHLELKNIENRENKGILHLLSLLGNPNTIVEEVVQYDQQLSSQLFLEKKMQQMEGSQSQNLEDEYIKQNKKLFEKEEDLVKSLLLEEKAEQNNKKQVKKKKRNYDFDDFQCVYEEGDLAYKQQEIMLIDFVQEEDVERESINIAMKYYSKTFKYLFNKYATSPQEAAKNRLRNLDQSTLQLRTSDVVKILQDYEIYNFSTYEEVINLVQTINHKFNLFNQQYQPLNQNQKDSQTDYQSSISATTARTINYFLDFENFKRFLIQYALIIFGRPPKDYRKIPAGHILVEFFKFFSFVARRRNENHLIYDDPDGVTTVADKQTIQKWNAQLLQNPQTEIPTESRLKKVQTEKVAQQYKMRSVIQNLSPSYLICFELLNDLIQSKFKTNIVEPTFKVNLIYEVKPIAAKGVHQDSKIDPLLEKQEYLKNSLTLLPLEKQELLNKSLDLTQFSEEKVINKSIVGKIINQQEEILKKELKDIKWKKHKEYLDKQFDKIQQFRIEKEKIRVVDQAEIAEQKVQEKNNFKPKHSDYMENIRKELRKNQSEVVSLIKSQPQLPIQQNEKKETKPKIKKNEPIKSDEKLNTDKQIRKTEKQQNSRFKAQTAQMAQHYKISQEKKEQLNEKFINFYKDPKVQAEFKHFRSSGSVAFAHYLKYSDAWNYSGKKIELQGWLDFCSAFNLSSLFTKEQIIKMFTNTLKQKNYVAHREAVQQGQKYQEQNGLSYFEFEYLLLKAAIIGQEYFNSIKSGKILDENIKQLVIYKDKQNKKPQEKHKHIEQLEENMNKTTSFTLAACLAFLDIPQNKDLFAGKLRSIEGEDIIEQTQPRYQSVDLSHIKKKQGLPENPSPKKTKWTEPGTHNKNQEQKPLSESQMKLPYLPKNSRTKDLLDMTKQWSETHKQPSKNK